jgi:hypothetical protein
VIFYRFGSNPKRAAAEEFDGTGGLLGAGRWHIMGKRVTYAATHEALALLEKLVHRPVGGPATYPLYYADVPDDLVEWLPLEHLPRDWRSVYPPISTQSLGGRVDYIQKVPCTLCPEYSHQWYGQSELPFESGASWVSGCKA